MAGRFNAAVTAVAKYLPERRLTNSDLEKKVDTSDEWIRTRTGISERRILDKGLGSSTMAIQAARQVLENRGVSPDEIDLIVVSTVTPDMMFPATACLVQEGINAGRAWGFDLSGACCGFLYALVVGAQFILTGAHKKVLVIGADKMSSIVDYSDRETCVLFGDGAGAVLLEPTEDLTSGLLDFRFQVDGSGGRFLYMPGGGSLNPATHDTVDKKMHFVHQDGRAVFKFAVSSMADISAEILRRNDLTGKDVDLFVPHQANNRIIDAAARRMGLEKDKVVANIDRYGNTTCGTIPIGLCEAADEGRIKQGDLVVLASAGAGYTWGSALLRWAF